MFFLCFGLFLELEQMTVTIPTKHELAERADDEDEDANGTCCCMEKVSDLYFHLRLEIVN